jgi:UDP-glucose 4-epimerase
MKIAVTGGAGFIGGHVVDELLRRGHEPVIFDHRAKHHAVPDHPDRYLPSMLGDTRDEVQVTELAAHVEGIIHLASVLGTQETVANPRPAVMTNVISGMNVFEAAVQYGIPAVNICVGNAGMSNPYSASKTCVESLGHMYVRDRGAKLNQVRVVNAYGPRQLMANPYGVGKVRKIMPAFVARALTGQPIEIYGDGEQVSDCVFVTDVAAALVNALEFAAQGTVLDHVVEVGPTEHMTVNEVARMVAQLARPENGGHESEIVHLPMRPGETPGARIVARNETMHDIGMPPEYLKPLSHGIAETVAWYAEHWLPQYVGHLQSIHPSGRTPQEKAFLGRTYNAFSNGASHQDEPVTNLTGDLGSAKITRHG